MQKWEMTEIYKHVIPYFRINSHRWWYKFLCENVGINLILKTFQRTTLCLKVALCIALFPKVDFYIFIYLLSCSNCPNKYKNAEWRIYIILNFEFWILNFLLLLSENIIIFALDWCALGGRRACEPHQTARAQRV